MKRILGVIYLSAGLLTGCSTNSISENAKVINDYTQSDIGTKLEEIGCEFSTNKQEGKRMEIAIHKCSAISNHDAIMYIKENLVDAKDYIKPLIYFKNGRQ